MRTRIAAVAATIALTVTACGGTDLPDMEADWDYQADLRSNEWVCDGADLPEDRRVLTIVRDIDEYAVPNDQGGFDWRPGVVDQFNALAKERCP